MEPVKIIFVHGYSATNPDTYGELPLRQKAGASTANIHIQAEEIFPGRYTGFSAVNKEVFRLEVLQGNDMPPITARDFKTTKPENDYVS